MFGMLEAMYQLINRRLKGLYKWNVKTESYTHPDNEFSGQLSSETDVFNVTGKSGWITYLSFSLSSDSVPSTVAWKLYIDEGVTPIEGEVNLTVAGQHEKVEFMPLLIRYRNGFRLTVQRKSGSGTIHVYLPNLIALEDISDV